MTKAPFMENSMRGTQGRPDASCRRRYWHRKDGGPFIGSGSIVIMRDPDGGWINASIYRVQVHGKNQRHDPVRPSGPPRRDHRQEILGQGQVLPGRRGQRRGPGAVHRRLRISAGRPVGIRLRRRHQGRADRGDRRARSPACRCRRTPRSSSKASCCRRARSRCRKARSASSPATTPPTRGPAR